MWVTGCRIGWGLVPRFKQRLMIICWLPAAELSLLSSCLWLKVLLRISWLQLSWRAAFLPILHPDSLLEFLFPTDIISSNLEVAHPHHIQHKLNLKWPQWTVTSLPQLVSLSPFLGQCKREVRIVVPVLKIPSEVREGEIRLSTAHPPSGEAYSLLLLVQLSISSIWID